MEYGNSTSAYVSTPYPTNKSKNDEKLDSNFVKIKLRMDPTSENSDLYELKTTLFDNGNPEEFLLFIQNSKMTLKASGTHKYVVNIQYLCTLVSRKALHQFYALSAEVESSILETLLSIILGLGMYFFPVNAISKQKRVMRRIMRKPHGLKVI